MSTTILEKPKTTTRKRRVTNNVTQSSIAPKKKKKTLWEVALELQKKPLFTIAEEDRDLIYGSNMMTRLLQEEKL